jgi:hypothetical protein
MGAYHTETSKRVITGKTQVVITGLYKKVLDTSIEFRWHAKHASFKDTLGFMKKGGLIYSV